MGPTRLRVGVKYGACAAAAAADGTAATEPAPAAARVCRGNVAPGPAVGPPALAGAAVGALANFTVTGSVLPSGIVPLRCLMAASASCRLS